MNNNNYLLRLFFIALILTACSDLEEITLEEQTQESESISLITYGDSSVRSSQGPIQMLSFDSKETFTKTIEELELNVERHDDDFMEQWGHLDPEALDNLEDLIGYDSDKPIKDFVNQFVGFHSLFMDIRNKENIFLDTDSDRLDDFNDPEDHFVFDDAHRAVLNDKGQVKIENRIYQFTQFGYISILPTHDVNILNTIYENDVTDIEENTRTSLDLQIAGSYYGSPWALKDESLRTAECETDFFRTRNFYPKSKRRIKSKHKMEEMNLFWKHRVKSKTIHYKKKNGRWKRRRAVISARIEGPRGINDCSTNPQVLDKTKNRRFVKKIQTWGGSNPYYAQQFSKRTVHKAHGKTYILYFVQ